MISFKVAQTLTHQSSCKTTIKSWRLVKVLQTSRISPINNSTTITLLQNNCSKICGSQEKRAFVCSCRNPDDQSILWRSFKTRINYKTPRRTQRLSLVLPLWNKTIWRARCNKNTITITLLSINPFKETWTSNRSRRQINCFNLIEDSLWIEWLWSILRETLIKQRPSTCSNLPMLTRTCTKLLHSQHTSHSSTLLLFSLVTTNKATPICFNLPKTAALKSWVTSTWRKGRGSWRMRSMT